MKKSSSSIMLIFALILSMLSGCTQHEAFPSFTGTMAGYKYYHTNERDRKWEEDVLFTANTYLTRHPLLADNNFYIKAWSFKNVSPGTEYTYDNSLYDAELRTEFILQINQLIARIPELSDAQIPFEIQKVIAILHDLHSQINVRNVCTKRLPLFLESMGSKDGYTFFVTVAPMEQDNLLYAELTSVNGVTIEEIVKRLADYVSAESEGFTAWFLSAGQSLLIQKEALQIIGVVAEEDTEAELIFELESGTVSCKLPFLTQEEYQALERVNGRLINQDIPRYRYDKSYWYEMLNNNTLYIRFYRMTQDQQQSLNDFIRDISVVLRDAVRSMKVVLDFRDNSGGTIVELPQLADAVNEYASDEVYILINESSISSGVFAPYWLRQTVSGAKLIGTPAAQFVRSFGGYDSFTMPNAGYTFRVAYGYYIMTPEHEGGPLMPDTLIYPSIEDYKNGIDTVLEYILEQ